MVKTLAVLQSQTMDSSQTVDLASASLASMVLVTRDSGTPAGDPVVVTLGGLLVSVQSAFTVQNGATLNLVSPISAEALSSLTIGPSGTFNLSSDLPINITAPVTFSGPNGTLGFSQLGSIVTGAVTGFSGSDTIDFRSVGAATSVTYIDGVLRVMNGATMVASQAVSGSFGAGTLKVAADGFGGFAVGDNLGAVSRRLSGSSSNYRIAASGTTTNVVKDTISGRDGTNTVQNGQAIGFTDGVSIVDPSGNSETLAHLYQAVLGRAPDLGGLKQMSNLVNTGTVPLASAGNMFINSAEFTAAHGTLTNTQFVGILAQNTGNTAATALDNGAISALDSGASRGTIAMQFAESANNVISTLGYSGDATYGEVYRLYETTLGRAPDVGGASQFITEAQSGTSLQTMASEFINSAEFKSDFGQLSNAAFVTGLYQHGLGRTPDSAGLQSWVNTLNAGTDRSVVALGISDSMESKLRTSVATHDASVFIAK
ncbi:DUF4214 domain-containing protein [Lichenicola cladoniae]|uniref:DUF4214 domain-containing protein n=1 Tax=Lichenicola cladoniae TaxID=1484109 RepID=A0A6M8HPF5_9PROT|nr:DUF4214 domain-containing protein [Lichenicola cladoniae]NPD68331.1 DUF4214 domain-containing protein [Acetobacteraceae bacterium]QKE90167.1 DUF4214 domain-containing protein [Lichenicola cladoniae]